MASRPPLFPSTPEVPHPTFSCWNLSFSSFPGLAPCQPRVPGLLAAAEGDFLASLLPACAPTCSPPAPLSCVPHCDTVSVSPLLPFSLLVIPSSSVSSADLPSLPLLHPSLSASLSLCPPPWRSPLSPSLLTCVSWSRRPRSSSAVVLHLMVSLRPVSASSHGCPQAPLFRPSSPDRFPPSYCRTLRPLAPPLALLPPALAANIARRDEDIGNWTGGVVARRLVAGGSAPRGKIPSRPRVVVGDGISLSLFLHLPQ